ncbi:MAG: putative sigma-54 modulation protein [Parasphingorhabdus sp.]|jgi:putative sigma-54 modulation protein
MQISVSGQHMDVTDALRSHVEDKMQKINRHFDHVTDTHVVLLVEKNRHNAEATINGKGLNFHATAEADDMYSAIDAMISKLDRQLLRHKEKNTSHRAETPIVVHE